MRRLLISALIIFAACDGGVTGVKTITGDWSLRTINGSPLPYTISGSGANKIEVIDDVYTFFEGFTFSETIHRRVTTNGQVSTVTVTETGAFSVFGTSITITGNTTPVRRGLIEGNTMTIVDEGLTSAYKK